VTRPEFSFLAGPPKDVGKGGKHVKVMARRFRGEWSQGLLVRLPSSHPDPKPGDDLAEVLGVTHYRPEEEEDPESHGVRKLEYKGDQVKGPFGLDLSRYDVESWHKYGSQVFVPGEQVVITEKLHGANARLVYSNGELFVGFRTQWKKEHEKCLWWRAVRANPV